MILYKYYPCNQYTYKSLAFKGLWMNTYQTMNDPFECFALIERKYTKKELDKYRSVMFSSNHPRWKWLAELEEVKLTQLLYDFRSKVIADYSFCSLSETHNDILMWSHYANNHKGIVLGIEFEGIENIPNVHKIKYQNELSSFDLERFAKFQIGQEDGFIYDIFKDYAIKSKEWSYEKEWRIWGEKPSYKFYEPQQVKEVYFGLKTDMETKAIVLSLLNYLPDSTPMIDKKMSFYPIGLK